MSMKQESPEKFISSAADAAVEAMRSGSVLAAGARQIQSVVRALDILEVLAK